MILKSVKKISVPNPAKSLGYMKCYNANSPLIKALAIRSDTTVERSAVE